MKRKYKFIILVIVTVVASVLIYNYIEASTSVTYEEDIFAVQNNVETNIANNTAYEINNPNIIVNPYGNSPLTALVVFQTRDLATVTVTVKGKDDDKDITNTFIPSKIHTLPIYGLYADYENTITISCSGEQKSFKIKTDKLPEGITNATNEKFSDNDEFYFTTTLEEGGHPIAYDKNGNVRWFLTDNYSWDFTRLSNGHILLSNYYLINNPYYSMGLVEMDLLGKIYYEYNTVGGYHHDVFELTNGNLLVASNNFGSGTVEDYIVEIDRNTGAIVKKFDLYNLMPNDDGNEWLKLNSLVYDAKTNAVIVAGSNKDMIMSVDYNSGEINWIIADKDIVNKQYEKYLLKDGDAEFPIKPQGLVLTKNGNIAYINSRDNENHLIEYAIDSANKSFSEIKNIDLGEASKTANLDYSNDTFIVNQDDQITNIQNDKITTTLTVNHDIYSTKYMNMYAGDVYTIGKGQRLGSTGITPTTDNHALLFYKVDEEIYDKYKLELYKDANRLVVNGTFKKSDDVQIILDNILDKKTYDVITSETPYIKDNKKKTDKVKTSTYVSEEGLSGKYYIYIRINGTTYKLYRFANFW